MLCNQTTSYFDSADVIICSSTHSEKGLPCLLVLAAKILELINSHGFLTLTGMHSVLNAIQLLCHSGAHYFSIHGRISVGRRTLCEHATQHSSSITLSESLFFKLKLKVALLYFRVLLELLTACFL